MAPFVTHPATRLTIAATACVMLATIAYAQGTPAKLAGAFPRSTMTFSEYWVTDEIRAAASESALASAGIAPKEIECGYQLVVDLMNTASIEPVTTAELRAVVTGVQNFASGVLDVQVPDISGGDFSPEAAMNIFRSIMVIEHSNVEALEMLLRRELEGGNPSIEAFEETQKIRLYTVTPRVDVPLKGSNDVGSQVAKVFAETMFQSLAGVVGFADNRYVVWGQRRADILNAVEGLRGDIEQDDTLEGNPIFRRALGSVPASAYGVSFVSIREILRLTDLYEPLSASLRELELDKFQAVGGHQIWDIQGRSLLSHSQLIFARDEAPGWYEILKCPAKDTRLAQLMAGSAETPSLATFWLGVDDLAGRVNRLGEHMEPRIERVMQIIMQAAGGALDEFGGRSSDTSEMAREAIEAVAGQLDDEIFVTIFAPSLDREGSSSMASWANFVVGGWANSETTIESLNKTLQAISEADGIGARPVSRTPQDFKVVLSDQITETGKRSLAFGLAGSEESAYVLLIPAGALGRPLVLFGSEIGIQSAIASLAANFQRTAAPTKAHGLMEMNLGALLGVATRALAGASGSYGAAEMDPISRHMVTSWTKPFSEVRYQLTATADETALKLDSRLDGMPKMSELRQLFNSIEAMANKEATEVRLRRIRSQIAFWHLVSPDMSYPESLRGLVKEKVLEAEDLEDPMGESSEFVYAAPPLGTETTDRWLLAWQAEDRFDGIGRIAILLNGEIVVLNQKQFDRARELAREGKMMPVMDDEGNEVKPSLPPSQQGRGR
jgi:hypothetical protein